MKRAGFLLGLSWVLLLPARAQVTVEVVQDQDQFLPGEAVRAKVRVTNRSGQTLRLGAEADWLTFVIQTREGAPVEKNGEVPVAGEFTLESSKVATKRVDLEPYFSVSLPGRYQIVAAVRIPAWDRLVTSQPKGFDIIEGAKLWEQEVGMPASLAASNAVPEVRKYILQEANYLKTHLQLYFRLTDAPETRIFRVFPIGPMVSFSRPEAQVDQTSNLHVIYQTGPRFFSYTVFNPDGDLVTRQTYEYLNTRPRLRATGEGSIKVEGGARRLTADDVPAASPSAAPDEAAKPADRPKETSKPKP